MAAVAIPVAGTLGSCVGCMMLVEKLAKEDPGCMNLMTFSTFVFIAIHGLLFTNRMFTVKNNIPISGYLRLVVIFFIVNVINNQALNFHVPVPLHIIFRSGSLLASLILGVLLLKRSYSMQKYISIIMITIGIVICTLATDNKSSAVDADEARKHSIEWMIGIAMLSFALIASAYLGVTQERLYAKYGKHPTEALFYVHFLSLPGFALMYSDIAASVHRFNESTPIELPFIGISVPSMWLYLLASDVAQYACISYVYTLTSECTSLTVTLVVTLRKFISLILSIWLFNNPFTLLHWVGAALVFAGTLLFAEFNKMSASKVPDDKKKK